MNRRDAEARRGEKNEQESSRAGEQGSSRAGEQ
jgi:hypothetical protein